MANQELTDLQILTALTGGDLFFVRDISTTLDKQISVSDMATFFGGGTFLSHSDTPANYTTAENQFVRVNSFGTGLEFVPDPGYLTDITAELLGDLSDVTVTGTPTGELLAFTGSIWENQTLAEVGVAPAVHTHVEADITDLQNYSLVGHSHVEADITDLQAYLLNITGENIGDLSDVVLTSVADGELLRFDGLDWINNTLVEAGVAPVVHTHLEADITDLQNYSLEGHTHVEADITDLQDYSLVGHTHVEADITDLQDYVLPSDSIDILADVDTTTATPVSGDCLAWNGSQWVPTVGLAPGAHAVTHVSGGTDEIDGDVLDITFVPVNYTRLTSPVEVTTVVELTAHLAGIDTRLSGTFEPTAHTHDAADVNSGTFVDARISQSSVTQHEAAIDHDALLNFVSNEHIDHSIITLSAGIGLSGGGNITVSRTFNLDIPSLPVDAVPLGSYTLAAHDGAAHKVVTLTDLLSVGGFLTAEVNDLSSVVTWANVPNANITESSVTQHEAALEITESQISDLQSYLLDINAESINELSDVDTTSINTGDVLQWSGTTWLPVASDAPGLHASTHVKNGSDELDGDNLTIDLIPFHYTALTPPSPTVNADTVSGHLYGIGTELGDIRSDIAGDIAALTFTDLTDTPGTYSGSGAMFVRVNVGETVLEFVDLTSGDLPSHTHVEADITDLQAYLLPADSIDALVDVDTTTVAPSVGEHLEWDGSNWVPGTAAGGGTFVSLTDTPGDYTGSVGSFFVKVNSGATALEFVADPGFLTAEVNDLTAAVVWDNVPDANITQSSVTQHETALTITESQISDLVHTTVVEDEGSTVTGGPHVKLNFVGAGVDVTDAAGTARIEILGGAGAIDDLTDVTITGAVDGELLRFNGANWINNTLAEAGVAAASHTHLEADITDLQAYLLNITGESIGDLSDVSTGGAVDGDFLRFNGTSWVDAVISESDISDLTHDIAVQDEGSGVANTPHSTLNFVGAGVAVADAGSGVATVTISGGGGGGTYDCQEAIGTTTASTNSTTFIDLGQMTLTTKNLGETGTYKITFSCSANAETRRRTYRFRIVVDGTPFGEEFLGTSPDRATDEHSLSFTQTISGLASGKVIKIQFAIDDDTNGNAVNVFNRSLVILGVPDSEVVA